MPKQVEGCKKRFGYYPDVVVADKKYGSRENRQYLKNKGIRFSGKPLGRPPPKELNKLIKEERKRLKNVARQRVKIEGKFGQGKRGYDLGLVKVKLPQTGAKWICVVFFVVNVLKWLFLLFHNWRLWTIYLYKNLILEPTRPIKMAL